jgi:hypothetical protein
MLKICLVVSFKSRVKLIQDTRIQVCVLYMFDIDLVELKGLYLLWCCKTYSIFFFFNLI